MFIDSEIYNVTTTLSNNNVNCKETQWLSGRECDSSIVEL